LRLQTYDIFRLLTTILKLFFFNIF
jgi:hypothetical protein